MTDSYQVTDRNQVRRVAKRAVYDRDQVHAVIDAAWIGHVAITGSPGSPDGSVTVIPMFHARMDDCLVFHGARSSRLMKYLASGDPVSVSFALVDGLVLAKSLFHHSMNYRSAVVFGRGQIVEELNEQLAALKVMSDKVMPGRWEDARAPSAKEMSATAVVKVKIESASAKIRTGDPVDDADDYELSVWSGVLPIRSVFADPVCDQHSREIPVPGYVRQMV